MRELTEQVMDELTKLVLDLQARYPARWAK